MKFCLLVLVFVLMACQKSDKSPEAALKDFVDSRIGQVIDKDFVTERVTGKMLESFQHMSEEDFAKFADMSNIKTDSFKVLSKSCQDTRCFLTYTVSYQTKKEEKTNFTSEVKKIAEMVQVEDKWLIADVSNIKTYHESLEPINPLE